MMRSYEAALAEQGFITILAVGFKEDGDDYRIKVAASPVLKSLSPQTWDVLLDTLLNALTRLYMTPMDDLEIQ